MTRLCCALAVIAGCADIDASNPYDPEAPATVKARGTLAGRLVAGDGGSLEGATVGLVGTSLTATVTCDEEVEGCAAAAFRLTEVPDGLHSIGIEADCYGREALLGVSVALGADLDLGAIVLRPATGTITGTVEVAGDAEVTDVTVAARGARGGPDADGSFRLEGVRACAQQQVVARLEGHEEARSELVEIPADGVAELDAPLVLVPIPGIVVGRVVVPAGDALPDDGLEISVGPASARTGEEGRFIVRDVPVGVQSLRIEALGYEPVNQQVPVVAARAEAEGVDVGAIRLRHAVEAVYGQVELADGQSPDGVAVELTGGVTEAATITTQSGRFRFAEVRGDEYRLRVTRFGYRPFVSDPFEVRAGEPQSFEDPPIRLEVQPGVVCGFLGFPDADFAAPPDDLEGCPTAAEMEWPPDELVDANIRVLGLGEGPFHPLAHNGYFRFSVRAGTHSLQFDRPGFRTVTRFNEQVDPTTPNALGTILLERAVGALHGEVRLTACPESDTQVVVTAASVADSRVVIASVPGSNREGNDDCAAPGTWRFPELFVGDYTVTFNAADYREDNVEATVLESEDADAPAVVLDFDPGSLAGVVAPEGVELGEPGCEAAEDDASGTEVSLDGTAFAATTDCSGAFALDGIRPGTYTLRIERPGGQHTDHVVPTVTVVAGRRTDLGRFPLAYARGGLSGQVELGDGASPENVVVAVSGPTPKDALADADGRWRLEGLIVGDYSVRASRDGYLGARIDAVTVSRDVVTPVDDVLRLPVDPGDIVGYVSVPEGQLAGMRAGIGGRDLVPVAMAGQVECTPGQDCISGYECADDQDAPPCHQRPGYFRFDGLVRGSYTLLFEHNDSLFRSLSLPNVVVEAGQTTRLDDIELAYATGRVVVEIGFQDVGAGDDRLEAQLRRTRVDLFGTGINYDTIPNPATGVAELPSVRRGAYTLVITHSDYAQFTEEIEIHFDGDVFERSADLALDLEPNPGSINGAVVLEAPDDGALADVRVRIPELGLPAQGVDPDTGAFSLSPEALKGGVYSLEVSNPDHGYETVVVAPVVVVSGEASNVGAVNLQYARSRLHGRVTDDEGAPLPGAFVFLSGAGVVEPALTDGSGAFDFQTLRVGEYDVTVSLACYESAERQDVTISVDAETDLGDIALEIDAGGFHGRLQDPEGSPIAGARVEVAGGATNADSGNEGLFELSGLFCGNYSVEVTADGFRSETLLNQPVAAGSSTDLGTLTLDYASGGLQGTVSLEGDSPEGIRVEVLADGEAVPRYTAFADGAGAWAIDEVRVGTYRVTARAANHRTEDDQVDVAADQVTEVNFNLDLDRGCLTGQLLLSDGSNDYVDARIELDQTGEVEVPGEDGRFTFADLPPGEYSFTASLDGYRSAQRFWAVEPGQACLNDLDQPWFGLGLLDETPPDAPVLELDPCNPFEPLPDFPDSPAYIAVAPAAMVNGRPVYDVYFQLDTEDGSPLDDANFDPHGAPPVGRWNVRVNGVAAPPASFEAGPPGAADQNGCRTGHWFKLRTPETNKPLRIELQAGDGDANFSEAGELTVVLDADNPPQVSLFESPSCRRGPLDAVRSCYTDDEVYTLQIAPAPRDPNAGCTYLYEQALADNAAVDLQAIANVALADFDTDTCLPPGTSSLTVLPSEAARTLYCVRAYDQAGRGSRMLTDVPQVPGGPAQVPNGCVLLEKDLTAPEAFDLLPNEVAARGSMVRLVSDLEMGGELQAAGLDRNFSHFELRVGRPGAEFVRVANAAAPFQLPLAVRGGANEVAFRAVDKAGNASEPVELTIHEDTVRELVAGARGIASTIDIDGTRVVWANPTECLLEGADHRGCSHQLVLDDQADAFDEPQVVGPTIETCAVACPDDGGQGDAAREVKFDLGAQGALYASYEELGGGGDNHTTHLYYWHFGADGAPGGGDDATTELTDDIEVRHPVLHVAVSRELAASVRYVWSAADGDPRYQITAYRVGEDGNVVLPADADALTVAPAQLDVEARVVELGLFGNNLWYRTEDGALYLWTRPADLVVPPMPPGADPVAAGVHAEVEVAGGLGSSVVGVHWRPLELTVITELDGEQHLHRFPQNGDRRFADRGRPIEACDCPEGACFVGTCVGPGLSVQLTGDGCQIDPQACGRVTDLAGNGPTMAWITEQDGWNLVTASLHDTDEVVAARLFQSDHSLSVPRIHLDRLAYLDARTGTPRAYTAEPSEQSWSGLSFDAIALSHPSGGDSVIAVGSFAEHETDGLYRVGIAANRLERLPDLQGFAPAAQQADWRDGWNYEVDDGDQLVLAGRLAGGPPTHRVMRFALDQPDIGAAIAAAVHFDVATPRIRIAVGGLGVVYSARSDAHDFGLRMRRGEGLGDETDLDAGDPIGDCDFVSAAGNFALCGGYANPDAPPDRAQAFLAWYHVKGGAVVRVRLDDLIANPPLPAGQIGELYVTETGDVVAVFQDDEIGRIILLERGQPQPGGAEGWSEDEGAGWVELYNRLGENLGRVSASAESIVFADERLAQQPEILRIRLADGSLDRLTTNDAHQRHPTQNARGIHWIDERYTLTADGLVVAPPALTQRIYQRE